MKIITTTQELRDFRDRLAPASRVAFVPTMGFLHEGHLSLLREGQRRVADDSGKLILSIFVNPTQFGEGEDLDRYPRDLDGDLAKADSCGVDAVFCPSNPSELYQADHRTFVEVEGLSKYLCGAARPGHFRGVCTIVAKLWGLVRPDVSLFGKKDFQQLAIVRRMHRDLFLRGEVVGMPIVREADGLAMSSRNRNLTAEARVESLRIHRFLQVVAERFAQGERRSVELLAGVEAAVAPGCLDYAAVVDPATLEPLPVLGDSAVCAMAAWFGGVRLIDNVELGAGGEL